MIGRRSPTKPPGYGGALERLRLAVERAVSPREVEAEFWIVCDRIEHVRAKRGDVAAETAMAVEINEYKRLAAYYDQIDYAEQE